MDTAESAARTVGALAAVLGLIWVAMRVARGRLATAADSHIRVMQRAALGKRSSVAVVRVADRCILVGVGESTVSFLAELPRIDDKPPALQVAPARRNTVPAPRSAPRLPTGDGIGGFLARARDRTVRR